MKVISKRTKIILGIIMLGLVAVIFYQSYAIFKESRKLRFIWGVVEDFEQTPDIVINVKVKYWDGTQYQEREESKFPAKSNHEYRDMSCTNSGNAEFNEDTWQMSIKNITEPTECIIKFVKLLTDEEKYGTSIPPYFQNGCSVDLYTKNGLLSEVLDNSSYAITNGNCNFPNMSSLSKNRIQLSEKQISNPTGYASFIYAGVNDYSFTPASENTWIGLIMHSAGGSGNATFSELKLKFADGKTLTIQEAVNQKYIQPLVLYTAWNGSTSSWSLENYVTLGNSGNGDHCYISTYMKTTNKSKLNGIQMNASRDFNKTYDGYSVYNYPDIDLSLIPFP